MKKLIYNFALFLTALDVLALTALGALAWYLYSAGRMEDRFIPYFIGAGIALAAVMPVIDAFRRKARVASKFDSYGRMNQDSAYEKMSVKQQKELDRQRMIQEEKILPTTMVKEMTRHGSKDPDSDLSSLTGLAEVKEKVREMEARMEFEQKRKKKKGQPASRHMVFFGPPGTGKTTVAQIMTAYLKKYGYIHDNRVLIANGSFLSGAGAAEKTEALVRRAFGGVLFIDEAYSLLDGPDGNAAVSALIAQMEDNRDKFVLILAGYENEMRELLNANPGFISRIAEFFYFRDYSDDEMLTIFRGMAKAEGFRLTHGGEEKFLSCVAAARKTPAFGNARTCRTMLDRAISRHSLHVKRGKAVRGELSAEDIVYQEENALGGMG